MLTEAQLAFFARNGFLQLRNVVDPATCAGLVELTHRRFPAGWDPHDSSTWVGEIRNCSHSASLDWFKGALKFQAGETIGHPLVSDNFYPGTPIADLAGEILGAPLAPLRIRGLYPIFPVSDPAMPQRKPHIEGHPAELVVFAYLDDVPLDGAGLSVWPGSHRDFYPAMSSKLDFEATEKYREVYKRWSRLRPIELHGSRGDLIFTHHRLLHGPSVNRSTSIRYAFLCDYKRDRFAEMCREAPTADIWADWPTIAALPAKMRDGASDYELQRKAPREQRAAPEVRAPALSKKRDSARLNALRHEGDVWIHVTDHPAHGVRILPRGSNLNAAGVKLWVNDALVESPYQFDLFHKMDEIRPLNSIRVVGAEQPLYVRAVQLRLPFVHSKLIGSWTIPADTEEAVFEFRIEKEHDLTSVRTTEIKRGSFGIERESFL